MDVIETRPNNSQFGTDSHKTGEWYGTKTWEEAVEQFSNGIPEKAERLKKSLEAFKAKSNISSTRSRPNNYYYGYAPNIPAAIIGLPKAMKRVEKTPQKIKAVSILYDMTQNCGTSAETLMRSGEAVLQLVYALECRGYRVALDGLVFNGQRDTRSFILSINFKEWKQSLDIMKLSFPITSPAMFRRFGFLWAETLPDVKSYVSGYGSHMGKRETITQLGKAGVDTKNSYLISVDDCESAKFDPLTMAKALGITM
jgi:hypothetical protein